MKKNRRKRHRRQRDRTLIISDYPESPLQQNYMPKLLEQARKNPPEPGKVYATNVYHDDWCDLLKGRGPCNCDPDVRIVPVTVIGEHEVN